MVVVDIKLVVVPQPKPLHRFTQNFQDILPLVDLEVIRFWGEYGKNCFVGNTLGFLSLKVCGCFTTLTSAWIFTKFSGYVNRKRI